MTRPLTVIGLLAYCAAFWAAFAYGALALWRSITMLDPQGVLSMLLLAGGMALLATGFCLRVAALHWIESVMHWPATRAARYIVAIGAMVMFAGVGSILTIEVGR